MLLIHFLVFLRKSLILVLVSGGQGDRRGQVLVGMWHDLGPCLVSVGMWHCHGQ